MGHLITEQYYLDRGTRFWYWCSIDTGLNQKTFKSIYFNDYVVERFVNKWGSNVQTLIYIDPKTNFRRSVKTTLNSWEIVDYLEKIKKNYGEFNNR